MSTTPRTDAAKAYFMKRVRVGNAAIQIAGLAEEMAKLEAELSALRASRDTEGAGAEANHPDVTAGLVKALSLLDKKSGPELTALFSGSAGDVGRFIEETLGTPTAAPAPGVEARLREALERALDRLKGRARENVGTIREIEKALSSPAPSPWQATPAHLRSEHPQNCPVTLRPFFMVIEHPERGMVATYGGPFDSYTIPEVDPEDGRFRCERYDHDEGAWVDGDEGTGWSIIREDELPDAYTPPRPSTPNQGNEKA
jgi:hypothetical protein